MTARTAKEIEKRLGKSNTPWLEMASSQFIITKKNKSVNKVNKGSFIKDVLANSDFLDPPSPV